MNHTNLPAFDDVQKDKPPFKGEDEAPFCQLTGVCHLSEVKRGQNNNLKFNLRKFMTWQISEVFYWLFNKTTMAIMQIKLRGTVHSPLFPPPLLYRKAKYSQHPTQLLLHVPKSCSQYLCT